MAKTYKDIEYLKLAKHMLLLLISNTKQDVTPLVLKAIDKIKNTDDLKAVYAAFAKRKGKSLLEWIKWREQYNKGLQQAIATKLASKKITLT